MQNFTESFLQPGIVSQRQVVAPAGAGAEAFIDAEDIAATAAATLTEPARHAGHAYTLTGPEALTFAETAAIVGSVVGEPVTYVDLNPQQWLDSTVSAGVPADYAAMLATLFDLIRSSAGAATTEEVASILGRAPGSFQAFADRSRDAWAQNPAASTTAL